MSKHLADHRATPTGARLQHFLRIARNQSEAVWQGLWQRPVGPSDSNRRVLEFIRIERNARRNEH